VQRSVSRAEVEDLEPEELEHKIWDYALTEIYRKIIRQGIEGYTDEARIFTSP
jgi:hypothetical protein